MFNNVNMCNSVVKRYVSCLSVLSRVCSPRCIFISVMILYHYILLYILFATLNSFQFIETVGTQKNNLYKSMNGDLGLDNLFNLVVIIGSVVNQLSSNRTDGYIFKSGIPSMRGLGYKFMNSFSRLTLLSIFLATLNLILLVLSNITILNPGPGTVSVNKPLTVFYNNVQGLINTRDLASENPPLNMTKMHELHGYLHTNKPDIVILNETWLKKSILDTEILPDNYKIFRLDRSQKTHPWDPTQPKKFRKNGGGVLIGHRNDLEVASNKINIASAQAELLSVMFRLPSGKKLCISTFYRVGTLGIENFTEFSNHFKLLASKNRIDKHILIGDFNINNVLWPDGHTNCYLHKSFVDFLINDLSHTQLISSPTHSAGNILDLMFTNIPDSIKSIRVLDHCESCLSDHFGISFNIDFSVRRKKRSIKKVYNYSKANGSYSRVAIVSFNVKWCREYGILPQFYDE